jgi:hypothetical protein
MTSKKLHTFDNNPDQWYVEEDWSNDALFAAASFKGPIFDPCCGMGKIPEAAKRAGYPAWGSDIVDRGYGPVQDFFELSSCPNADIVSNPPYNRLEDFISHALAVTDHNRAVAVFTRLAFLCSSKRYPMFTQKWPLAVVLVCSKRVNCLPGANLLAGQEPGGGAIDYCWIVFDKKWSKMPIIGFLHPQGDQNEQASS